MLHLDQLGHIVVVYPAQSTKTIISARGGNDDGDDGGVHYLLGLPYLQLILCDGPSRMLVTNILYNVEPSLEMPADLSQDHEESLNQPDQSPLVPPHGAHLVQPSGLQVS